MNYVIRPIIKKITKPDNTILFAAQELQKYFSCITESEFSIIPDVCVKNDKNVIYIGTKLVSELPEVEDDELDDSIYINVEDNCGIISGNNARATLIAVYRFLKEQGFCFLRPGKDGEIYPEGIKKDKIYVCEKASYRHRGICIEGSVFQRNLMDIIDWIPKVAMNGYFIQFQSPREFMERWYTRESPYREKKELSDDEIQAMVSVAEIEIEKRSLLYHAVGHGWTSEAFGIGGSSWGKHEEPESEYRDILALVNGKRALWNGQPLNTSLCYSKEKARTRMTDNIVKYCKNHPDVSYLHFWLADDNNNNCECEECRRLRTSDYYVMMLNELDEKLTEEGLDTKIVFLIYVDLLWKPISEKLKNKDRFVLMFAPITRSYSESYKPEVVGEMKPYELNKLQFPKNVADNLAYLYDWQKDFDGDGFDFDYHFIWDHYYDFPQFKHAQILSEDMKKLGDMGLNGLMSCQTHRAFFPTSLSMNVMVETLWDKDVAFEDISDRVLKYEFGEKYKDVKNYLGVISENSCAEALRGEKELKSEESRNKLISAVKTIEEFKKTIMEQIEKLDSIRLKKAWEKLKFHGEIYSDLLEFYLEYVENGVVGDFGYIRDAVLKNEMRFKDEFDSRFFLQIIEDGVVKGLKEKSGGQ